MAIATGAKRGLTRRHLLVRSASTVTLAALGSFARPYLSRAADRPQIACGLQSGDVSTHSAVVWARVDRPARMQVECSAVESFRTIIHGSSADALPDHDFAAKLLLEGLPSGRIFSTAFGLTTSARPGYRGKHKPGISGPRRPIKRRYLLSGPAIPQARAGASIPRAAACEPTGPS
jgi:alkaline phosphatase D